MKPLFHPSLYQFDQAQPSYWEATAGPAPASYEALDGDHNCDVAIIGGGYSGLSTALHLARDFNIDVCLLEAGHIGWGASGRNGDFCAMGITKLSLDSQLEKFGVEQTRAFHQAQADAVNLVRALGEDEDIDFLPQGDAEFVVADSDTHFAGMQQQAETERHLLGLDVTVHGRDEFRKIGYDSPHQHGAVANRPSFGRMPEDKSVYFAYGYHDNGVNSATWSGRELAKWLAVKHSGNAILPTHLPSIVRGRPPRFPLAALRRQYLRLGLGFYRMRDYFDW